MLNNDNYNERRFSPLLISSVAQFIATCSQKQLKFTDNLTLKYGAAYNFVINTTAYKETLRFNYYICNSLKL